MRRGTLTITAVLVLTVTATPARAATGPVWQPCPDFAAECTTVQVPLDYADPAGRRIDIAVSRQRATDPSRRSGVLLTNPGGPGGSGLFPIVPTELTATHDVIGFDPRGVGASTKVHCVLPDDDQPPPDLPDEARTRYAADWNTRNFTPCQAADPAFARQLTTANIARDMDRIRIALGERKIDYYGLSWGSVLGTLYRSMFDAHVGRMAVNSVMPARFDGPLIDRTTDAAVQRHFHLFAQWLATQDARYHFGTTQQAVEQALIALGDKVGHATVADLTTQNSAGRTYAAGKLADLRESGNPPRHDGPPRDRPEEFAAHAVICNELTGPREFAAAQARHEQNLRTSPLAGGTTIVSFSCLGWPEQPQPWQLRPGHSPLQLIAHAEETKTPGDWAESMRRAVGGRIITIADDNHGSDGTGRCHTEILEFFVTGRPARDTCS